MTDDQPQVAVNVHGPHLLTVVAMPIASGQPTPDEAAAMEQAIKDAQEQALQEAQPDQP